MATRQRKSTPKPKKAVRYIALRYIDKLVPGQEVPAQVYQQAILDEMVEKGQIEKVE